MFAIGEKRNHVAIKTRSDSSNSFAVVTSLSATTTTNDSDSNNNYEDGDSLNKRAKAATTSTTTATILESMEKKANEMKQNAESLKPLSQTEIDMIIQSLQNVADGQSPVDFTELSNLLREVAHKSHKDWTQTGQFAERLHDILLPGDSTTDNNDSTSITSTSTSTSTSTTSSLDVQEGSRRSAIEDSANAPFRTKFERVLHDGNWDGAITASRKKTLFAKTTDNNNNNNNDKAGEEEEEQDTRPWVVLVTGVNGIRKSTTVYQPWFPQLLRDALIPPQNEEEKKTIKMPSVNQLPSGSNSFFRQLDHMIAILANEEFQKLYQITSDVDLYAKYKAGIFARFRTLSEMLGIILVREAQKEKINVMVETSGRDIAMFKYVDTFFDDTEYRKLVLHFKINDLAHAEESVDRRMMEEMRHGREALEKGDIRAIIKANAGGPYGSQVLKGVQTDSDRVWKEICAGKDDVGKGWYKATIEIRGDKSKPWSATAIRDDASRGKTFEFPLRK